MRWFRFALLILLVTLLQAGLLKNFETKPDLLLILLVFFAVYSNRSDAVITSFTIGFAADIIAPVMGPQIISFGLFGTSLAYLNRVMAIRKMTYQGTAIFIISFLAGALAHFLTFLKGEPAAPNMYTLFWTPLFSGFIGPFLFLPAAWWMRIKTQRSRRY
jgi:rod shape-determining protein MreD